MEEAPWGRRYMSVDDSSSYLLCSELLNRNNKYQIVKANQRWEEKKPHTDEVTERNNLAWMSSNIYTKSQQFFSVIFCDILGFGSHMILVTTDQLCFCSVKAAMGNLGMSGYSCVLMQLYRNRQLATFGLGYGLGYSSQIPAPGQWQPQKTARIAVGHLWGTLLERGTPQNLEKGRGQKGEVL